MKAKKWLTTITLIVSLTSLILALVIGKESNCITYDILMAIMGSAVLGFIMSITEYFVEKRKAMEEFWIQATNVLKELRKVKYLDEDAPIDLIINAFYEERSNELAILFDDSKVHYDAKNSLISWYKENVSFPSYKNTDIESELEQYYMSRMDVYRKSFIACMDSYQNASTVELGLLDNAYGNLDFLFANKCIRKKAFDSIYDKLGKIVDQFRSEAYHFNLLKKGEGSLPVCATKVSELNTKYFLSVEKTLYGYKNILIYQNVFDDIDVSLEMFRCKIYRTKYKEPKNEPISGKMIYFGEEKK